MQNGSHRTVPALVLGLGLVVGLGGLGKFLADAAIRVKEYERTVTVKGLSERELPADVVIWPIQFAAASNDLSGLYGVIESNSAAIAKYLADKGLVTLPGEQADKTRAVAKDMTALKAEDVK